MTIQDWLFFLSIWFVATLPLGPNAANCIAASLTNGLGRGLWSVAGIVAAAICHMAVTSFGLSSLLLANSALFQVVKWCGVAYLAWMGLSMLTRKAARLDLQRQAPTAPFILARRGFLISMTNPKAILSYLAIFPQFIQPGADLPGQLWLLVPPALAIIALIYGAYCALGSWLARLLAGPRRRLVFGRGIGGFYLLSALGLAGFDPRKA